MPASDRITNFFAGIWPHGPINHAQFLDSSSFVYSPTDWESIDKIKLKKNKLKQLLKLRYRFVRDIDNFIRYITDNNWDRSIQILHKEIYSESDERMKLFRRPFYLSYADWGRGIVSDANKLKERIAALQAEFENKGQILQHLANYRNASRSIVLNVIMIIIAAITLFFVIFPSRATWLADIIRNWFQQLVRLLR